MPLAFAATAVTYEDVDFLVHGTINQLPHEESEVEISGVYLKDSTVDLAEILGEVVMYELSRLVLSAHNLD